MEKVAISLEKINLDYDEEADVLYLSFGEPREAKDSVEVEGRFAAKRGKLSGKKQVWRCPACLVDVVLPFLAPEPECPRCRRKMVSMLKPLVKNGEITSDLPKASEIREYVLEQIGKMPPST